MIVYSVIQLPQGSFKALVPGSQSDGSLTAKDGYEMYRLDSESPTLFISNPRVDKSATVHEVPWSSVDNSERDEAKTDAACEAMRIPYQAPIRLGELLKPKPAPAAKVAVKAVTPTIAGPRVGKAEGFPGQKTKAALA